jgi:hypothetical protein
VVIGSANAPSGMRWIRGPQTYWGLTTIGLYRGEVCLFIEHSVRAWMKSLLYSTKCAITAKDLIAVECGCKQAGCKNESPAMLGEEKICCTHGATLPMMLSLQLYETLAASFLMDIRTCLHSEDIEALLGSNTKRKRFRDNILLLMSAGGFKIKSLDNRASISEWLQVVTLSTDRSKGGRGPPDPKDLKLLREIQYI